MKKINIKKWFSPDSVRYSAPFWVCIVSIVLLLVAPTGFEDPEQYKNAERCVGEVLETDESAIFSAGMIRTGTQVCTVKVSDGLFKGETLKAYNPLQGSLEKDKLFEVGDKAQLVVNYDSTTGEVTHTSMIDHYRVPLELIAAGGFVIFLILFAGKTGLRAIFSFALTILAIWKLIVPLYLNGYNPIWVGLGVTLFLTVMIIALVYGFDVRCASAVSGSFLGILVTCVLGILFTDLFKLNGATLSYAETLLYTGYGSLNLKQIFMASIFIGSSGAVMDLSVDITSAVHEVVEKRPDISALEAVKSGMNVGRAAMGTMTTTLLLAYSGGYMGLLMVFMAQSIPTQHIFNYKYVASEVAQTIIGSFGLVTVAPLTAVCAGILLTKAKRRSMAKASTDDNQSIGNN
ncbi:MAG: YibE/F family protein [Clostridia bacterium]|nr:YibE/F family protein [Clostridia bacterium]